MEGNHPKRRKDKYNPYNIYELNGNFYISFKDGQGVLHKYEISRLLYETFNAFELDDLAYLNVVDRHIEHSEIWESSLHERSIQKTESVEDVVFRNIQIERLHKAISELPEIQRRRLKYYYFDGLTYDQIAKLEKCKHPAVIKSIKAALKKLKKLLSE